MKERKKKVGEYSTRGFAAFFSLVLHPSFFSSKISPLSGNAEIKENII
jgi:hypothetical protein